MESYLEFKITCTSDIRELLLAEMAEENYEGFVETDEGFTAFIPSSLFNRQLFEQLLLKYGIDPNTVPQNTIAQQNWNAQWEASYEPIIVADRVMVKAPFHELNQAYDYVLTIQPKNTFGTGHHATTQLMLHMMLESEFQNKQVLDFGCGTGVLGIMALKLGAKNVTGIDIDEWCTDNIQENIALNNSIGFEFRQGTLSVLNTDERYDCILANINKNILMQSFSTLSHHLNNNGLLLISGFYESDLNDLRERALTCHLHVHHHLAKDNWCAALLKKHDIDL
jgi:ribosomal protein L11 methyltransferase